MIPATLVIVVFLTAQMPVHAALAKPSVKFSEGRLSISAEERRLDELAEEIGKKTGIVVEFKKPAAAENLITLHLANVAPQLAMERILHGFNFASLYEQGRLSRVIVLSSGAFQPKIDPAGPRTPSQPLRRPLPRLANSVPDFEELVHRNRAEGMAAIERALKGSDQKHKLAAVDALDSVEHPDILKLLGQALNDADEFVRRSALKVLSDKKGPAVVPLLTLSLHDSDPSVRIEVLEALADRRELQLMKTALLDPNEEVKTRARDLLEWLASRESKRSNARTQ